MDTMQVTTTTISGTIKSRASNSDPKLPLGGAVVYLYRGLTGTTNPIGEPWQTPNTGHFEFSVQVEEPFHVRVRYAGNGGQLIVKMIEMDGMGVNLSKDHQVVAANDNEIVLRKDWA